MIIGVRVQYADRWDRWDRTQGVGWRMTEIFDRGWDEGVMGGSTDLRRR